MHHLIVPYTVAFVISGRVQQERAGLELDPCGVCGDGCEEDVVAGAEEGAEDTAVGRGEAVCAHRVHQEAVQLAQGLPHVCGLC